jgi:hypothetical protein
LKLGEPCNFYGIPKNVPETFQDILLIYHIYLTTVFGCHFLAPWAEAKTTTLPKSTNGLTLAVTLAP